MLRGVSRLGTAALDARYVLKAGDTMTGPLQFSGTQSLPAGDGIYHSAAGTMNIVGGGVGMGGWNATDAFFGGLRGAESLRAVFDSGANGWISVNSRTASRNATIFPDGTQTNNDLNVASKGSGTVFIGSNGLSTLGQFAVLHTASSNRYVTATGSNGGNPAIATSAGGLALSSTTPGIVISTAGAIRFPTGYGAGAITSDASGNLTSVSDGRLKNITRNFERGLKEILALEPVMYRWRQESGMETGHEYPGFIAQQVGKFIPEAISEGLDGTLSFNDRAVIGAIVNAIKELAAR